LGWGDVPGDPPRKLRDGSTAYAPPFPALVSDRVRCVGDSVAFVVAESRVLVQDAAELIKVD
jgi:carbon-monoxide dehydrogenase large subunit